MTTERKPKRKRRESFGALRKLPSGRYQASYTGPDGNRYNAPHTYDNTTDAKGWLAVQQASIVKGDWSPHAASRAAAAKSSRSDTFADFAQQWLSTRTNRHGEGLRDRTRFEYQRLVDGPLKPLGEQRLASITSEMVRAWYSVQIESGKRTQAARAYGLLKSILATAVEDGRIIANPCLIRGAQNATTGREVTPPTAAEFLTIVGSITPRYRAAIVLAGWGALRYGELTELRRKDVRTGAHGELVVNVTRAVTHTPGLGFVVGKTKSSAGVRSIIIPPHVQKDVETHLSEWVADSPDALLFPASDGMTHLAASTFEKHWTPARKAAGRGDMAFHALRHFGATRFAQTGATLQEIQDRLGHSTVAAAMRYQHSAGRETELVKRMSELADT